MYINNAWGKAHERTFEKALENAGRHTLVATVVLPKFDDNDIQAELTKLKPLRPTLILTALNLHDPAIPVRKNRELGLNMQVVAHNNIAPNVLNGDVSSEVMEGLVTYHLSPPKDSFVVAYRERFGREPISEADTAYDALFVIKEAMEKTGATDAESIRRGLREVTDYDGVSGRIDFSEHNYPENKVPILKVFRGGEFVPLESCIRPHTSCTP